MSEVAIWFAGARAAARAARSRELWPAGAVAALAYLGWLPLVLTVAPSIRSSQLILFGAGLASASLFPLNLLLIAAGLASIVLMACALAAIGEAAVLDQLDQGAGSFMSRRHDSASIFAVLVIATLPAAVAAGALVAGLAVLAPDALTSPDGGVPLIVRLGTALGPFVIALVSMVLVGQALGAAALRRSASAGVSVLRALGRGALDVLRRPAQRLGIAFVAVLADLTLLALSLALLAVAWAPITLLMGEGRFLSPEAFVRLAGFVLAWLVALALMGMAHAWISAWWSIELAPHSAEAPHDA